MIWLSLIFCIIAVGYGMLWTIQHRKRLWEDGDYAKKEAELEKRYEGCD